MRKFQGFGVAFLIFLLAAMPVVWLPETHAQTTSTARAALERGYRTGYSDGYQEGYKDYYDGQGAEFCAKTEFLDATRAYETKHGPRESYRDGYKQGYSKGYQIGYGRGRFDPTIPTSLRAGGSNSLCNGNPGPIPQPSPGGGNGGPLPGGIIPANTVMKVEMLTALTTQTARRDDGFRMRVIEPQFYEGAIIEGHLSRVKQPGKIRGRAEMQLTFDRIRLANQQVGNFEAQIIEVTNLDTSDVRNVDQEGGLQGKDSVKKDTAVIGGATAAGAVIGIAGGPVGIPIGAGVGAIVGTAIVLNTRGQQIRIARGQQFKLLSSGNTRFVASAPDTDQ